MTAAVLTGLVRIYALRRSLLDIPTERSSHKIPTPRGGGLAVAVVVLGAVMGLGLSGRLSVPVVTALAGGGGVVAVVGFIDDHRSIPALWRACVHLLAAFWALYWLGGFPEWKAGTTPVRLGWSGTILAGLGIAWLTNLYNFMDGTDGLAGIQGVCAGGMGALLLALNGEVGIAAVSLVLASACAGFLIWNWPPARIFMGDVGSCLIGYTFAVLAVVSESTGTLLALTWFILLSVFICDATFTLALRVLSGERWYAAHRSHAYQRFVQMGFSHRDLALSVLTLNLVILSPSAYLTEQHRDLVSLAAGATLIGMGLLWVAVQRKYTDFINSQSINDNNKV